VLGCFFGALLNKSVPFFAPWAFSEPFGCFVTAILTEKGAFCFLTKVFKKACLTLAFRDLIRNNTELKNIFFKNF